MNFDEYIDRTLKHTYLSKAEKVAWKEEVMEHLEESRVASEQAGISQVEASQAAMRRFGHPSEVRRWIVRETYGISPTWFIIFAVMCFVMFVLSVFVQIRSNAYLPPKMTPIPAPQWVLGWQKNFYLSNPNLLLGLAVVSFMMVFTRKRTDRIATVVSPLPLGVGWLIVATTSYFYTLDTNAWAAFMVPLSPPAFAGYLLLLGEMFGLYYWTRNRKISVTPWVFAFTLTFWPILSGLTQMVVWHITGNPIFWNSSFPTSHYYLWWSIRTILMRLAVLGLFALGGRQIDVWTSTKKQTVG